MEWYESGGWDVDTLDERVREVYDEAIDGAYGPRLRRKHGGSNASSVRRVKTCPPVNKPSGGREIPSTSVPSIAISMARGLRSARPNPAA